MVIGNALSVLWENAFVNRETKIAIPVCLRNIPVAIDELDLSK